MCTWSHKASRHIHVTDMWTVTLSSCAFNVYFGSEMTDLDGRLSPACTPTHACVPEFTLWWFSRGQFKHLSQRHLQHSSGLDQLNPPPSLPVWPLLGLSTGPQLLVPVKAPLTSGLVQICFLIKQEGMLKSCLPLLKLCKMGTVQDNPPGRS